MNRFVFDFGSNEDKHCNHHIRKILELLIIKYNYQLLTIQELLQNRGELLSYFKERYSVVPDHIISYEGTSDFIDIIDELSTITNISFIVDDIHHSNRIKSYRRPIFKRAKYLFLTYAYKFLNYFPEIQRDVIFFPHSACYQISFNERPLSKVLISGHRNEEIYPDREYLIKLSKDPKYKCKLEYYPPDYSGYMIKESESEKTFGSKYYQLLNHYICSVVDESVRDYILAKVFEILASGSLLLALNKNTKPIYRDLGLYDGVHYISVSREDIHDKIDLILDPANRFLIDRIRLNGYNLLYREHYYTNRAEFMHKILNKDYEMTITRPFNNTLYSADQFYIMEKYSSD